MCTVQQSIDHFSSAFILITPCCLLQICRGCEELLHRSSLQLLSLRIEALPEPLSRSFSVEEVTILVQFQGWLEPVFVHLQCTRAPFVAAFTGQLKRAGLVVPYEHHHPLQRLKDRMPLLRQLRLDLWETTAAGRDSRCHLLQEDPIESCRPANVLRRNYAPMPSTTRH